MTTPPLLGEFLSVVAALGWAAAVVLFKKSGEETPAIALNLFKNVVAFILLVLTLLVAGVPFFPDRPLTDWGLLAVSGWLAISVADTLFFLALERLGAGLVAIVDTLYSPAVIALSVGFLGERLGTRVFVGAGLVVGAILVGAADRPALGRTRRDIVEGTILGVVCMLCLAGGIVMVKDFLGTASVLWTATVRMFFGIVGLLPFMIVPKWRRDAGAIFRPRRVWIFALPASVLGPYVSTIAWLGGFKFALASVAAVLNQMSTIFIFVLAAIFLKEPLTPRRTVALAMAVSGAVLATLR